MSESHGNPMTGRRWRWSGLLAAAALVLGGLLPTVSRADAVEQLRAFVRDTRTGQASFTQTVRSTDGQRETRSSGDFAFARPDRFRFEYRRPFEQLIVADGQKIWIFDPELNQASSRPLALALGATPAALLAGAALEPAFELRPLPAAEGLSWAQATPRETGGAFQHMRVGFRGAALAVVEITDSFGQVSTLRFGDFTLNAALPAEQFRFRPPPGADVIEQ